MKIITDLSAQLSRRQFIKTTCFLLTGAVMFLSVCCAQDASEGLEPQAEDYREARSHFQTKLVRHGPAPQKGAELRPPAGAQQVEYSSQPPLKAWVSIAPDAGQDAPIKHPAVLFLHGGFAMSEEDWNMAKPYRAAGFVLMTPVLRGENGQSGDYSMFYNEVKDVLTAANYLANLPNVDSTRMYIAGHSVGGTLTLLSAMTTNRFRAAASFSGSPDQVAWSKYQPEVVPFDPANIKEFQMRSPIAFATSFKCPVRMYYGNKELWVTRASQRTAILAQENNLDVAAVSVPGDHSSAVPDAMQQSIKFFLDK